VAQAKLYKANIRNLRLVDSVRSAINKNPYE